MTKNKHVWEGLRIKLGLWIHCKGVNREVALRKFEVGNLKN